MRGPEEFTHSGQATATRQTHFVDGEYKDSGGTAYPAAVQEALDDAHSAYRETKAARFVLAWLGPYLTTAPAAQKAAVVGAYKHWLKHLRDELGKLCAELKTIKAALPTVDLVRLRLEGCKNMALADFLLGQLALVGAGSTKVKPKPEDD